MYYSYFQLQIKAYEVFSPEGLLHLGMDRHGRHLLCDYPFFPAGMGIHLLVGPKESGRSYDGYLLGMALPIPDTILETPAGGQA